MRAFTKDDYETLKQWFKARGITAPTLSMLPQTGFIVDATAAGFLVMAEGRLGFLEYYISNSFASKDERDLALEEITKALMIAAQKAGVKRIMFNTKFASLKKLAFNLGFQYLGEYSSFAGGVL